MRHEIPSIIFGLSVIAIVQFASSHPTSGITQAHNQPNPNGAGDFSRPKVGASDLDTTVRSPGTQRGIMSHGLQADYQLSPDSGIMDHEPVTTNTYFRARRSSESDLQGKSQLPDEFKTLVTGNWHSMDPESLLRLVTNLATKVKESPVEDDEYYSEDDESFPVISLSSSGRNILSSFGGSGISRSDKRVSMSPMDAIAFRSFGKTHGFSSDFDDDYDPATVNVKGLRKKAFYPFYSKRAHSRKSWPLEKTLEFYFPRIYQKDSKDFTMLPNGEIALTNHGLLALRHLPSPLLMDDGVPVIRRPIL